MGLINSCGAYSAGSILKKYVTEYWSPQSQHFKGVAPPQVRLPRWLAAGKADAFLSRSRIGFGLTSFLVSPIPVARFARAV